MINKKYHEARAKAEFDKALTKSYQTNGGLTPFGYFLEGYLSQLNQTEKEREGLLLLMGEVVQARTFYREMKQVFFNRYKEAFIDVLSSSGANLSTKQAFLIASAMSHFKVEEIAPESLESFDFDEVVSRLIQEAFEEYRAMGYKKEYNLKALILLKLGCKNVIY